MTKAFNPCSIAGLEPRIGELVDQLLDGMDTTLQVGRADLIAVLAEPLPVKVTVAYPGAIGTNIAANSGLDMSGADTEGSERKVVEPSNAATHIIETIASDRRRIIIGPGATTM